MDMFRNLTRPFSRTPDVAACPKCGAGEKSIMTLPDPKKPNEFLRVCRKCGYTVRLANEIST